MGRRCHIYAARIRLNNDETIEAIVRKDIVDAVRRSILSDLVSWSEAGKRFGVPHVALNVCDDIVVVSNQPFTVVLKNVERNEVWFEDGGKIPVPEEIADSLIDDVRRLLVCEESDEEI